MHLWIALGVSTAATVAMTIAAFRAWRRPAAISASTLSTRLAPLGGMLRPKEQSELDALRARLACAGWRDPEALDLFLSARVLSLVGGLGLALLLAPRAESALSGFALGLVCVAIGFLLPPRFVDSRAAARRARISRALPGAVDLLVTCIDAGLALEQALQRVAQELGHGEPILADELLVVVHELDAGVPVAEAMRRLGKRVGLEELETLCAVVGQASQLGARVGQTLRDHAASARKRRMAELDERAGKIGAALTLPLALCLLPASLLVMLGPAIIVVLRSLGG